MSLCKSGNGQKTENGEESKLIRKTNKKKMTSKVTSQQEIYLASSARKVYQKFPVYQDQISVRCDKKNKHRLHPTDMDEDNSSSQQIVSNDIRRSLKSLQTMLKFIQSKRNQID